jgi:hypothetical protein
MRLQRSRPFSPADRAASELARRAITAKGAIDVKDLGH